MCNWPRGNAYTRQPLLSWQIDSSNTHPLAARAGGRVSVKTAEGFVLSVLDGLGAACKDLLARNQGACFEPISLRRWTMTRPRLDMLREKGGGEAAEGAKQIQPRRDCLRSQNELVREKERVRERPPEAALQAASGEEGGGWFGGAKGAGGCWHKIPVPTTLTKRNFKSRRAL